MRGREGTLSAVGSRSQEERQRRGQPRTLTLVAWQVAVWQGREGLNRGLILLFRGNGQAGGRGKGRSFVSSRGLLLAVAAGGHHWHCGSQSQCVAWWISAVAREVRCCAFPLAAPPLRCVRCLLVSCEYSSTSSPVKERGAVRCGCGICRAIRGCCGWGLWASGLQLQEQDGDARPGR